MNTLFRVVLIGTSAVLATGRIAAAQRVVAADSRSDADAHAIDVLLSRPVTIDVTKVSLRHALDAVASSAKVPIQYRARTVDERDALITLHLTRVPLRAALDRVLSGTGLRAQPDGATQLVIVEGADSVASGPRNIGGVVTEAKTGKPLAGASVVVDSLRPVRTRANGTFVVSGVSAGFHKVAVRLIGYHESSVPADTRDGDAGALLIALSPSATVLNEVVTTVTGDRKRYEVGNAIATIKADSIVATSMIRNMSDLLQARVPGVVVSNTDGAVGAPSKIRLRGLSSLSLNNDPIVIVDGVRMNAQTTSAELQTNVGSQQMTPQLQTDGSGNNPARPLAPSRLDDIDPNTVESIQVLRGPSASSLYGTDAANGVIIIKTKRGQAGAWRATLRSDYGESNAPSAFPELWFGWGRQNGNQETTACQLAAGGLSVIGGSCVQDSVTHFNPQNYGPMKTLGTGTNQSTYADLSGGTTSLQQFFSVGVSSDVGMAKMSDVSRHIIDRYWTVAAPSWMVHPNTQQEIDGASRTTVSPSPKVNLAFGAQGLYRNVLNSGSGIDQSGNSFSPADSLLWFPSQNQRTQVTSNNRGGTLTATADIRPLGWLSLSGTAGGDYGLRTDESNLQARYCTLAITWINTNTSTCPSGRLSSRGETFVTTANSGANLNFSPFSWLSLQTALGQQYNHTRFYNMSVGSTGGCALAFGTTLLTPDPVCRNNNTQKYSVSESRDEGATAGIYIEETLNAFGIFYTFGVRRDLASAFGSQVENHPPKFPKLNFSYPISDQSYFPKQPYVTSLRLRLSYGQSGNQASRSAVLNNYQLSQAVLSGSSSAMPRIDLTALGNADLRPEKATEWEGGFDVSFLEDERIHLEATMYRKMTRDMITSVPLTPSLGQYTLYYNLGNVEDRGLELDLNTRVIDTRAISWDLRIAGMKNTNKLVHKAASLPPYGPSGTSFAEGYPLYGFWGVPVESYADVNGDGIIAQDEIIFGTNRYMGAPYPKGTVTYSTGLALLNGSIRLDANIYQVIGQTTRLVLGGGGNRPRAAVDPTAPLSQQAAYLQTVANNGAIGASSTVQIQEMSATYLVPPRLVQSLRAKSLAISLAGRNLGLWSSYAGRDPNVDTSGLLGEVAVDNGLGTPQPRIWTLRFSLGL